GEESLFLTRFAERVTMLVRGPQLSASKIIIDKLNASQVVDVRTNTEIVALSGESSRLSGITVRDRQSGSEETLHPAGVFVFIGLTPNSAWLPQEIQRDAAGFITTSATLETSMPGVFAAGDVRLGSTKQAASAAGEGATAALMIREYLKR
ncbi:MAG TPA: NAD(P)/FAD-dependent oxidoreductase, partial [Roseiflexaceae bacterium]|nr:NAD(P)/FAD-dependent oxidoreductase [Roseiflexaceae bacterium]